MSGAHVGPGSRVAVLGAGALGLVAARRLQQAGAAVTVFEREPLPGGLAAGFELEPGVWLEKFYHHLFGSDRDAIRLIEELGLGDRLAWTRPVTATLRDGRVWQLDSPSSLLRFGALPLPARVRMGAWLAYLRALGSPERLEGHRAADWIRARMGAAAFDVVWGPLLRAKFGDRAEEIALPWFWARVHDRTPQLGYPRGGFQQVYRALADGIGAGGGAVELATEVRAIRQVGTGLEVDVVRPDRDAEALPFDAVVSTLPTRVTLRLTEGLPEDYRARYEWGAAYGAHCTILVLDRALTDVYWLNVNDPGFGFMALVEHTNYRPPAEYGGRHLVYLGNYRPMDDPIFKTDGAALLDAWTPQLQRINPGFRREWVQAWHVFAAPFAQPIVTTDYRSHIPPFETPIPGLFVANMFMVYPHDRGQNYSVRLAERLVARLARPRNGS